MEELLTYQFQEPVRRWITVVLFWSGFAAWVGMIVGALFRSTIFSRPWPSFCLGWLGVALGPVIVRSFLKNDAFEPISPTGISSAFIVSIGAVVLYYVFSFLFPSSESANDGSDISGNDVDDPYEPTPNISVRTRSVRNNRNARRSFRGPSRGNDLYIDDDLEESIDGYYVGRDMPRQTGYEYDKDSPPVGNGYVGPRPGDDYRYEHQSKKRKRPRGGF